jgi:hypothetical protein
MFAVFFSALVLMALLNICGEIFMRVRVAKRSRDKMAWWRRGGDEIATNYGELFPGSYLPAFRRFFFWVFLGCCVSVFLATLWKSN